MRTFARMLPLLAALVALSGCLYIGDWGNSEAYKDDFHYTYALNPGGAISVENFNGSIEIIGWEQNSVEVNGTKYASSQAGLDSLKIDLAPSPGSLHIRVIRPLDSQWHMGARFSIRVPRHVTLDRITSSNGAIRIEDLQGPAHLHTSNGAIRVSRLKGNLDAQTSNGSIETEYLEGNANLHTSNGAIHADAMGGSFEAVTSNGSITARLDGPTLGWPVRVHSSNGHVELALNAKQLPEVRVSTSNSSIVLRLPASANARIRAATSHSNVSSEFDELRPERSRRHSELDGTIGSGGPLMDLTSSNGSIKIQKM